MILWVDQKKAKPPAGHLVLIHTYDENKHGKASTGYLFGQWDGEAWLQRLAEDKHQPLDPEDFKVDAWALLTKPYRVEGKTMFEDALGLAALRIYSHPDNDDAGTAALAIEERYPELVKAIWADYEETGEL